MECGAEISPDVEFCGKCGEKVDLVVTSTAGTQTPLSPPLQGVERVSANPSNPLTRKSRAKYAVLGGVLAVAVFLAGVGYKLFTTPIYSVNTVAGKFEIINIEKDGGEVDYKLNEKTVLRTTEMHGATAEIHDVYNLNDRSLLVITWNINNSKISRDKFIVYFYEIDKNGRFTKFFDGFSTNRNRIAVIESKGTIEFQIRVEPEQIGYQRVVFNVDGARQISNWKWADENREKERQQKSLNANQERPPHIRAGAIACEKPNSFFIVSKIEALNDAGVHGSLPEDCEIVPIDLPTKFSHYISTQVGSDLIQVGLATGTVYVRNYDLID